MNTKAMYEKTGVAMRTIQGHVQTIREMKPNFAEGLDGNILFSDAESEAYIVMLQVIEEHNNVKYGVSALIEHLERSRILARINTLI